MTNIEQYINNDRQCFPPINTEDLNIPKRCSRYLLIDKYLSEFKTKEEKRLVMLNILLMDTVPRENSTRLVNSGTVYKVMRDSKTGLDLLTELYNYLQRTKADKSELENILDLVDLSDYALKSELFSGSYNDLTDKPNLATLEYVLGLIDNLIDGAPEALNTLKEITDKLTSNDDIVNQILNLINDKANKSDVYTKIQLDNLLEIEQENISGKANNSDLLQTNELIQQLLNRILLLESKLENIKHEILTQEMYDNLQQYDPYTVYFIVEQLPPTPVDPTPIDKNYWAFGDGFPVIFSKNKWRFGLGFPIIFSEGWTFGDGFPIEFSNSSKLEIGCVKSLINITELSNPTERILITRSPSNFSSIEVDGIQLQFDNNENVYYDFDTPGEHTIKCTLIDPTIIGSSAFEETDFTNIIIPDTVTTIEDNAFYLSNLESIIIPDSVETIGNFAFGDNYNLKNITIGSSVTNIGLHAFEQYYNNNIESIVISNNNTVYDSRDNCNAIIETSTNTLILGCKTTIIPNSVTSIGEEAFKGCADLTSINIPDSITSIGDYAFVNCPSLTSIDIPNSVTSIGFGAFSGCIGLTSIDIPNSVISIGDYAFAGTSLTNITIPSTVTSIGYCVFQDCANLVNIIVDNNNNVYDSRNNCNAIIETSTNKLIVGYKNTIIPNTIISIGEKSFSYCKTLISIIIPDSVTSIGDGAFEGCNALTSVTIPNSVTSIGQAVFANCSGLTSVTIGNSVTYIGDYAFYRCTGLTTVTIPNSVTTIKDGAFYGCRNLTNIVINAVIPPTIKSEILFDTNNCPIYVPSESVETYKETYRWDSYADRIQAIP